MEMYTDLYLKKEELEQELEETQDTKIISALMRQLNSINSVLGETEIIDDPLIAKWEREWSEGKDPDLTEGL